MAVHNSHSVSQYKVVQQKQAAPSPMDQNTVALDDGSGMIKHKQPDGSWCCTECGYSSKIKTNLEIHVYCLCLLHTLNMLILLPKQKVIESLG
jgi:hypothetical protein